MGRTDAWALDVPAPPMMPVEAAAPDIVANESPAAPAPRTVLDDIFAARKPATATPANSTCPACSARLSDVERKFERCLSCGKSFATSAGSVSVGI